MLIKFSCHCGVRLKADESLAGKKAKCSKCGAAIRVPIPKALPESSPAIPQALVDPVPSGVQPSSIGAPPLTDTLSEPVTPSTESPDNKWFRSRRAMIFVSIVAILVGTGLGSVVYLRSANDIEIVECYTADSIPTGPGGSPMRSTLSPKGSHSKFLVVTIRGACTKFGSGSGEAWKPTFEKEDLKILLKDDGKEVILPASGGKDVLVGVGEEYYEGPLKEISFMQPGFRPDMILLQKVTTEVDGESRFPDPIPPLIISFFVLADEARLKDSEPIHFQFKDETPIRLRPASSD